MELRGLMLAGTVALLAACGAASTATTTQTGSPTPASKTVTVRVEDSNGNTVATATLTETSVTGSTAATSSPTATASGGPSNGVRIQIKATSLSRGSHGLSITSVGKCDPPGFVSAGAIFNPDRRLHGYDNPAGPKNGDLPGLAVGSDGTGSMDFVTNLVTLESGQPNSLDSATGTAMVINAHADDQRSQPDGDAGLRIACGVISPGSAATPSGSSFSSPSVRATATPSVTSTASSPSATVTGAAN